LGDRRDRALIVRTGLRGSKARRMIARQTLGGAPMAKKTKEELVAEGKALNTDITAVRSKGAHNFAVYLADEGVIAMFDKVKSADALRTAAKKAEGATSKGAVGTVTVEGKDILLKCAEGETPPPKLGKAFKKHLKERGLAFKVVLVDATDKVLEADEEEAVTPPDPTATTAPPDATDVPRPTAVPNPDNGIKDKLEKAFEKIRTHLIDALKAAPVDYQPKLKTPALAYSNAMKAQDYETALAELGKLRAAIVKTPSVERLTQQLTEKADPAKLVAMKDLMDGIVKRAGAEPDFDKSAKPLMKEMRAALKVALAAKPGPTGADLTTLTDMKKQMDDTFLAYLATEGHGPQRHEGGVTKVQLTDRAWSKKDPMTGTTVDGAHGGTHRCGKTAARIKEAGVYVDAEETFRASPLFTTNKSGATSRGEDRFEVKLPIKDVLGDTYKTVVEGVTVQGSNKYPTGTADTDFTDGFVIAVYDIASDGTITLMTMYPDPKA
jgi:hypothetical protein